MFYRDFSGTFQKNVIVTHPNLQATAVAREAAAEKSIAGRTAGPMTHRNKELSHAIGQ